MRPLRHRTHLKPTILTILKILMLALAAVSTLGCDHHRVEESATEDFRFASGAITRIEVRIDDGRIAVEPSDAIELIEVNFHNRARAADRDGARSLLDAIRVEAVEDGDTLRVRARVPGASIASFGGDSRTDVTLRIPEGMALDLRTRYGRIQLERISGDIKAETGDGRIRLDTVKGTLKLRTGDGSVIGTELTGSVDAASGDGRIQLEGSFDALRAVTGDGSIRITSRGARKLTKDWNIRTSDGSIELTLPASISAHIEATSANGRIVNDLSTFEGNERNGRAKGTLSKGGPLILVTTMDGRITLKES